MAPNYSALLAHRMQVMVYLLVHFHTSRAALLLPSLLNSSATVLCQQHRHENELTTLEIHAQLQALLTLPTITLDLLLSLCNTHLELGSHFQRAPRPSKGTRGT